jgi:hypothetical protein
VTREEAIKCLTLEISIRSEAYRSYLAHYGKQDLGEEDFLDALYSALDALKEQPRWISVEERLPEVGVTVLTLDKHGHICDRYMYRCSDGTALFTAKHLVSSKDVTHWMPLPEAPEVEV